MPKKTAYKEKLDYNNAYNRSHYRSFSFRFNKQSESEIIEWLESKESTKQYILNLIKEDLNKNK